MTSIRVEQNLELRLVAESYAEETCAVIDRNFDYLHEWMQWAVKGYTIEMTRTFFSASLEQHAKNETTPLLIFLDGKIVGGTGLNFIDKVNKGTELGYWLDSAQTGKGIVTKCCKALIDHAFKDLGMRRMMIRCASGNIKSRAIPVRLGFREEGTLREAEWLHDKFVDLIMYAMLKREWESVSGER